MVGCHNRDCHNPRQEYIQYGFLIVLELQTYNFLINMAIKFKKIKYD